SGTLACPPHATRNPESVHGRSRSWTAMHRCRRHKTHDRSGAERSVRPSRSQRRERFLREAHGAEIDPATRAPEEIGSGRDRTRRHDARISHRLNLWSWWAGTVLRSTVSVTLERLARAN